MCAGLVSLLAACAASCHYPDMRCGLMARLHWERLSICNCTVEAPFEDKVSTEAVASSVEAIQQLRLGAQRAQNTRRQKLKRVLKRHLQHLVRKQRRDPAAGELSRLLCVFHSWSESLRETRYRLLVPLRRGRMPGMGQKTPNAQAGASAYAKSSQQKLLRCVHVPRLCSFFPFRSTGGTAASRQPHCFFLSSHPVLEGQRCLQLSFRRPACYSDSSRDVEDWAKPRHHTHARH